MILTPTAERVRLGERTGRWYFRKLAAARAEAKQNLRDIFPILIKFGRHELASSRILPRGSFPSLLRYAVLVWTLPEAWGGGRSTDVFHLALPRHWRFLALTPPTVLPPSSFLSSSRCLRIVQLHE